MELTYLEKQEKNKHINLLNMLGQNDKIADKVYQCYFWKDFFVISVIFHWSLSNWQSVNIGSDNAYVLWLWLY